MSEFVWLDYSERERRKMLDIVDLFREHNTRDELGIGSVRDTLPNDLIWSIMLKFCLEGRDSN
jgi:hypothetical protein